MLVLDDIPGPLWGAGKGPEGPDRTAALRTRGAKEIPCVPIVPPGKAFLLTAWSFGDHRVVTMDDPSGSTGKHHQQ